MSDTKPLRVLSLGAGVQSSTVALLAAHGEIEPIDLAIFADTKAEPAAVYEWLDWLTPRLPFEVVRVQTGEGLTRHLEDAVAGARFAGIPAFTGSTRVIDDEHEPGGYLVNRKERGQLRRQCTREFKIDPILREVRRRLGLMNGERAPKRILATRLVGISLDEVVRMKPSFEHYIVVEWPLIDLRMTRGDCLAWMHKHGYPEPPRSACVYCPYHRDAEWRRLRDTAPEDWAEACRVDGLIRSGVRGTKERLYLHRSLVPLAEADISDPHEGQLGLWDEECEGLCGV